MDIDYAAVKEAYRAWSTGDAVSDADLAMLLAAHNTFSNLYDIFGIELRSGLYVQGDRFRQALYHRVNASKAA